MAVHQLGGISCPLDGKVLLIATVRGSSTGCNKANEKGVVMERYGRCRPNRVVNQTVTCAYHVHHVPLTVSLLQTSLEDDESLHHVMLSQTGSSCVILRMFWACLAHIYCLKKTKYVRYRHEKSGRYVARCIETSKKR